jgi:hypothetical protein
MITLVDTYIGSYACDANIEILMRRHCNKYILHTVQVLLKAAIILVTRRDRQQPKASH